MSERTPATEALIEVAKAEGWGQVPDGTTRTLMAHTLDLDSPDSVERLAEAIWYGSWEAAPNSWEGVQSTQDADECHREARAIIAALREGGEL